ncbi:MAG: cd36 protein [Paramarteilia canceri]
MDSRSLIVNGAKKKYCKCCKARLFYSVCGTISLFGLLSLIFLPYGIASQLALVEGTESYEAYMNVPMKTNLDVYLFSITNHQEFKNDNYKPKFKQIGPYSMLLSRKRTLLENTQYSLTTQVQDTIKFNPKRSVLDNNSNVTTVNIPEILAYISDPDNVKILDVINVQDFLLNKDKGLLKDIMQLQKPIKVNTGHSDIDEIYKIETYDGKEKSSFDDGCNEIKGEYEMVGFAPSIPYTPSYFNPALNRTLHFKYSGYRFARNRYDIDPDSFNMKLEKNSCFKQKLKKYNGMMFMLPLEGVSSNFIGVSFPHFLHAGDELKKIFASEKSLKPSYKLHQGYIEVEKVTGLPVSVHLRLQINIEFRSNIYPIIWQEASVELEGKFKYKLYLVHFFCLYLPAIFALIGLSCLIMLLKPEKCWNVTSSSVLQSEEVSQNRV